MMTALRLGKVLLEKSIQRKTNNPSMDQQREFVENNNLRIMKIMAFISGGSEDNIGQTRFLEETKLSKEVFITSQFGKGLVKDEQGIVLPS
tara:strand:+ start:228 stop:500 length:273 start_codon:yes stop_codon:yes gene_type:complete